MLAVTSILLFEAVEVDQTSLGVAEEAERNIVFGVGFCEKVVEDGPVVDVNTVLLATIGNAEKDRVLFAFDFVLR